MRISRTACVVKGGRRFSFNALSVVGNRKGKVGIGFGKANDVPSSIEKSVKEAKKAVVPIPMKGTTIPHEVIGVFGASRVLMRPASRGTGIIAGASVRAVVELLGIKDILTKSLGNNNPLNLVKATMVGLQLLRTREQIEKLRGLTFDDSEFKRAHPQHAEAETLADAATPVGL